MQERLSLGPADHHLESLIESILLVAGGPVTCAALVSAVGHSRREVQAALDRLKDRLVGGIRLQEHDGSVQLVTAPDNIEVVHRFLGTARAPGLSRAALETLVVIAYRQPATRAEIENARGVNSDRAVQTLMARGLVEEVGTRTTLGRPMQYGTSFAFLEYFGLASLQELPPIPADAPESLDATSIGLRQGGES